MELVLSFHGSRGDVQPGVALAVALTSRGHIVRMAVPPNLVDFARNAGVDAIACGTDTGALLGSELVTRDLKSRNPAARLRAVAEITYRGGVRAQADLVDICAGADAIVGGSVGQERSLNVAQALGIPYLPVHYCPIRTNGVTSLLSQWGIHPPPPVARASWRLLESVLWHTGRTGENRLRADLGLPAARTATARRIAAQTVPEIQAYDPALFPGLAQEWGTARPLVGFLNLTPATRRLIDSDAGAADLTDWLDRGDPPIYVGFGSMSVDEPGRLRDALIGATRGHRVLVATGWSDFMADTVDDRIHVAATVDHDTVLPRCAAAIHHGGAGSTAAGLRAGLPTIVCWLGADQPIWGNAVQRAGVGVSARLADIRTESLSEMVDVALAPHTVAAARSIGERLIGASQAVDSTVSIIESTLARRG